MRFAVIALVLSSVPATADVLSEPTPEAVEAALTAGETGPYSLASFGWGGVGVTTPLRRMAALTGIARKQYQEVPAALAKKVSEPVIEIIAMPKRPARVTDHTVGVIRVVVLSGGKPIQPLREEPQVEHLATRLGARLDVRGMKSVYPLDALRSGAEVHVLLDRVVTLTDANDNGIHDANDEPIQTDDVGIPVSDAFVARLR